MTEIFECPICKTSLDAPESAIYTYGVGVILNCPRCGQLKITQEALDYLLQMHSLSDRQRANVSGWVREHLAELDNHPLTRENIYQLVKIKTPSFEEREIKAIRWFEEMTSFLGDAIFWGEPSLIAASYSLNYEEVEFLVDSSVAKGLLARQGMQYAFISSLGYDFVSRLNVNPGSMIGFCAMWFDKSVARIWEEAIEPAIASAGYQPHRIDKKEHVNRIDDEIFADIRRSRFVVADFTHGNNGVRGGVYFEAGFAQGLGLPVIWTCRKDMLSEEKLHFDIRQYNFLDWTEDNLDDFRDRLQKRIEAILGRGSWKPDTQ